MGEQPVEEPSREVPEDVEALVRVRLGPGQERQPADVSLQRRLEGREGLGRQPGGLLLLFGAELPLKRATDACPGAQDLGHLLGLIGLSPGPAQQFGHVRSLRGSERHRGQPSPLNEEGAALPAVHLPDLPSSVPDPDAAGP